MERSKKLILLLSIVVATLFFVQSAFAASYTFAFSTWATVQSGSSGNFVYPVQANLWSSGYSATVGTIDGSFGTKTTTAVKAFQTANNLTSDGIVGSVTWSKFDSYCVYTTQTDKVYLNPGSTTYQTNYTARNDGAGNLTVNWYLTYRSNGAIVNSGYVF